jgi:hypothetical protein
MEGGPNEKLADLEAINREIRRRELLQERRRRQKGV